MGVGRNLGSILCYRRKIQDVGILKVVQRNNAESIRDLPLFWSSGSPFICAELEEVRKHRRGAQVVGRAVLWYMHPGFHTQRGGAGSEARLQRPPTMTIDSEVRPCHTLVLNLELSSSVV